MNTTEAQWSEIDEAESLNEYESLSANRFAFLDDEEGLYALMLYDMQGDMEQDMQDEVPTVVYRLTGDTWNSYSYYHTPLEVSRWLCTLYGTADTHRDSEWWRLLELDRQRRIERELCEARRRRTEELERQGRIEEQERQARIGGQERQQRLEELEREFPGDSEFILALSEMEGPFTPALTPIRERVDFRKEGF